MHFKSLMLLILAGCLALGGCANTVAGAGEDISAAGQAISKAAK